LISPVIYDGAFFIADAMDFIADGTRMDEMTRMQVGVGVGFFIAEKKIAQIYRGLKD
jgi:hypothetical protein